MNGAANVIRHENQRIEWDGNRHSLIRRCNPRLPADDFKTGFHLEVGEPTSDGYSLGTARRRQPLTSRPELQTERASVDHDTVGVLYSEHIGVDGMSGYPDPRYPEPDGS